MKNRRGHMGVATPAFWICVFFKFCLVPDADICQNACYYNADICQNMKGEDYEKQNIDKQSSWNRDVSGIGF